MVYVKREPILLGLEAVGVGDQGPQRAVEPVGKVRYENCGIITRSLYEFTKWTKSDFITAIKIIDVNIKPQAENS
jgi:hypothetical protein